MWTCGRMDVWTCGRVSREVCTSVGPFVEYGEALVQAARPRVFFFVVENSAVQDLNRGKTNNIRPWFC